MGTAALGCPAGTKSGSSGHVGGVSDFDCITLEDRWILSRFNRVTAEVNDALATYRFHEAANRIYDFFWGEFCDWYIELIKPRLNFEEGADKAHALVACANLVNLFDASLRLLHPIMPFITEEIWHAIYEGNPPLAVDCPGSLSASGRETIRSSRRNRNGDPAGFNRERSQCACRIKSRAKVKVPIEIFAHEPTIRAMIEQNRSAIERLGNVENITFVEKSLASQAGARSTARFDVHVIYEKKMDVAAERERLNKELEKIEKELANNQRQLGNEQFLAKAPQKVVDGLRRRADELTALREKIKNQLDGLNGTEPNDETD